MALGLKHWLGLVVAGCAALALWALPPSAWELPTRQARLPEEVRERALLNEVTFANAKLQRIRWADSLRAITLASSEPLVFGFPEDVVPAEAEVIRDQARKEVTALGEPRADVAVGVFYVDFRSGLYPKAPNGYSNSSGEYYLGEQDGRAYCFAVQPVWRMQGRVRLNSPYDIRTRSGVCQFVARFGLPGPAMLDWLSQGGTAMAATLSPSVPGSLTFSTGWGDNYERRGYLGIPNTSRFFGAPRLALEQCFAGMADGCGRVLLDPQGSGGFNWYNPYLDDGRDKRDLVEESPVTAMQSRSPLDPAARHVAADLIAQFGADRFQRWWQSEGPLDVAFRDAFGVDPGAWHQERVVQLVTVSPAGPDVTWNGVLGVLAFLAAAAFVGGGWARRRTVA